MKKYFICFKPKGEFYQWLKMVSDVIERVNPGTNALHTEELLHLTFHKPIGGEFKPQMLELLNFFASKYRGSRVVLTGFGFFQDNIVIRVQPTLKIAKLWYSLRHAVESLSHEQGSDDDMLHVTLFKKVKDVSGVKIAGINSYIPLEGKEFPLEYICLFEKEGQGPWVEAERIPLISSSSSSVSA